MDDPTQGASPRSPLSPARPGAPRGLGDLRNVSRKPWSRSADDLGKFSSPAPSPVLTPIDVIFNDRIDRYRTGRNDSLGSMNNVPSPSTSIASVQIQKNLPFPTIKTSEPLSSSPPQQHGLQPPSSSSTQFPSSVALAGSNSGAGHVHARSHSFTPRLPSKLSVPKGLMPPSPIRKGSAPTEGEPERQREKTTSGGSAGSPVSARSPFPFGLGANGGNGGKAPSPLNLALASERGGNSAVASPTMLSPPIIVEPESAKQDKRTSQVVYHAGFINRLVTFSPSEANVRATQVFTSGGGAPTLSKGWKPFKLVLKGSKLYFYKPPSDRSAAVKELFPTELVAVLEDEGLSEEPDMSAIDGEMEQGSRGGKGKEREEMRRRRAYWGRGTHPSLVVTPEGHIDKGTLEALVHESVFATTSLLSRDSPAPQQDDGTTNGEVEAEAGGEPEPKDTMPASRYKPDWRQFSSAILLALPCLVGRPKFETEFMRCCSSLINGAEDDVKEEEVVRAGWLVSQYLGYHCSPANAGSWDSWLKDTLPDFTSSVGPGSISSGLPQSSLEGLYIHSPKAPELDGMDFSPNIGTFSPRPADDSKILSIVEALGVPLPAGAATSPTTVNTRSLRAILERVGLTKDGIMGLDVQLLALSLSIFHKRLLKQVPDNFPAELCLGTESESVADATSLPDAQVASSPLSGLATFCSIEEQPHWLTRLVLIQILVADLGGGSSHGGPHTPIGDDRPSHPSRTHSRSDVISTWVRIGERCRRTGDECSWRAIFTALCSRPVARLDKVWKRVDTEALSFVQAWVQPDEHDETMATGVPQTVPWAGEVISQIKNALEVASVGDGDEWQATPLLQVHEKFEALRIAFALCTKRSAADPAEVDDVEALVEQWQRLYEGKSAHPFASKFVRWVIYVLARNLSCAHSNTFVGSTNLCRYLSPLNLGVEVYSSRITGRGHQCSSIIIHLVHCYSPSRYLPSPSLIENLPPEGASKATPRV